MAAVLVVQSIADTNSVDLLDQRTKVHAPHQPFDLSLCWLSICALICLSCISDLTHTRRCTLLSLWLWLWLGLCLQWVMAVNLFYILGRLMQHLHFHGRLSAITRTIQTGLVDLTHFAIIFAVHAPPVLLLPISY